MMNIQFPPLLAARALRLWLTGNIHFKKEQNGTIVKEEKEDFVVFRKVVVSSKRQEPFNGGVTLKVFFRFKRFSLNVNRILSLIPIPLIIAQPGFRSKTWMFGQQTGTFHGLYEWDDRESAEQYRTSLPLRLMLKRAVSETVIYDIID